MLHNVILFLNASPCDLSFRSFTKKKFIARTTGVKWRKKSHWLFLFFQMPHYVISHVQRALNDAKKPLNGSRVLLLGVAYKPNLGDTRETPGADFYVFFFLFWRTSLTSGTRGRPSVQIFIFCCFPRWCCTRWWRLTFVFFLFFLFFPFSICDMEDSARDEGQGLLLRSSGEKKDKKENKT